MANSKSNQLLAVENGAISLLLPYIDPRADEEVAEGACMSLNHLAKSSKHSQDIMREEGVLTLLATLIRLGSHTKSCCTAVAALGSGVMGNKQNQNEARDLGSVEEVACLLDAGQVNPVRNTTRQAIMLLRD